MTGDVNKRFAKFSEPADEIILTGKYAMGSDALQSGSLYDKINQFHRKVDENGKPDYGIPGGNPHGYYGCHRHASADCEADG